MTRQTWTALILVLAASGGCDDSTRSSPGSSGYSAGGGSSGGAGAPAAPAPEAADLPPAKAAALKWALALESGDAATAKSLSVGDATRMKGLERLVAAAVSQAKLEAVLKEKFGPRETVALGGASLPDEIRRTPVKDEGATVTIWAYLNDKPLVMKQQPDGGWKVDLTEIAADTTLPQVMAKMNDRMAADVKAGKYKTSEEAWEAAANQSGTVADEVVKEVVAENAADAPAEGDGLD